MTRGGRNRLHRACLEALMVADATGVGGREAAAAVGLRSDKTPQDLVEEVDALLSSLPRLDGAVEEALSSRGKDFKALGLPERAALRYGAWLLLGPQALDAPLASKIAADLVDRYGEADARPLVQGCLSRVASLRPPSTSHP